jgi:soluble lytic murein transglycosylase-like protein
MPRQQIDQGPRLGPDQREKHGARALLRSRRVQAVLAATMLVQVGIGTLDRDSRQPVQPGASVTAVASAGDVRRPAAPVARPPASDTMRKPAGSGLEATAARLAAEYRRKGFSLTDELARTIVGAASSNGIGPDLAFGLVATESEFKRTARSPVGAVGLAQLMPATASLFEPGTTGEDLKNPEKNLRIGFRFLNELIDHYRGDTATALTAYNRGPTKVDRILAEGGNPDNGYAGKVMGN